jgi:hypothetical protein
MTCKETMTEVPGELSARRGAAAFATGVVTATVLSLLVALAPAGFIPDADGGLLGASGKRIRNAVIFISFFSFIGWTGGLLIVGAPVWRLMHRAGFRRWFQAVAVGAVLAFGVRLALAVHSWSGYAFYEVGGPTLRAVVVDHKLTALGWRLSFESAAWAAVIGGVTGFTIWYIAYGRRAARRRSFAQTVDPAKN